MKKHFLFWMVGGIAATAILGLVVGKYVAKTYATVYWTEVCGDGKRVGKETYIGHCDDGNRFDGDGCSSSCLEEPGAKCSNPVGGASKCIVCGNGRKEKGEQCDDGDRAGGDGCGPGCSIESGWNCKGNGAKSICSNCGNAILEGDEGCDFGDNNGPLSACNASCKMNKGWTCVGGRASQKCRKCGNGIVESGEKCDDGNESGGCVKCGKFAKNWTCTSTLGEASVCHHFGN